MASAKKTPRRKRVGRKMKTHLHKFFVGHAENHAALASHHLALSKHHRALADVHKADGEGAGDLQGHIADTHVALAEEHSAMGRSCVACAKAFAGGAKKAFG